MAAIEDQARSIFLGALERAPDPRIAFLDEACGDNAELRARVDQLLHAHEALGSIHGGGSKNPDATRDQPVTEQPGTVIDSYKLLEHIGEGGFGVVYMAEQLEPVRRKVALKILKPGMDTRQVVARFEAERQALAIMDHPNIAKVFDGGVTLSGRPYFVMELVKGVPITEFCDQNHLTPRQRLELFVPVCQAVQHAHQKAIIHRDLKPSNVLVTRHDTTPIVKVIDFGVAKALGQELTDKTLFTGIAQMIGTPLYMSPEQAGMSDLDIDTRSDIYSLGVMLYELLTGTTPFSKERFKQAAYDEIRRIIREEEPPKPSTRLTDSKDSLPSISAQRDTEPARLTKLVRGELDWIVMKALEKDRNRRYETANGFAMDVQRYLADEPVSACPPSAGYRLRKFARRNKAALATAALVLFFIVLLGGVIGWGMRDRAAREGEIAREEARKLGLVEQGIRQALDRANTSRAELYAVLKKPSGVQQLLNQPARWELFLKTAQGELAQSRRLALRAEGSLDVEVTRGMDKLEQELTSDQADYELALRLETIHLDTATIVKGDFDCRQAIAEYQKVFARFGVLSDDPADAAGRLAASPIKEQLVAALDVWARTAFVLHDKGKAERLLTVARRAAPDPAWGDQLRQVTVWGDRTALEKLVARAPTAGLSPQLLGTVGRLLWKVDSPLEESWLRKAQAEHPADFWLNYDLGGLLGKKNQVEAVAFYRAALAVRPRTIAVYNDLGFILRQTAKVDEAIACFRKAIELDPKHARPYSNLGSALRAQGKLDEAIDAFRTCVELNPKYAGAYHYLGLTLQERGKLDEAINAYHKAIEVDPKFGTTYNNLGLCLQNQNKPEEAGAYYKKAIDLDPRDDGAHINLAGTLTRQGKLDEAITWLRKAVALEPKQFRPQCAAAHNNLGNAFLAQGKLEAALEYYRKAIEIHPKDAVAHMNVGNVFHSEGKLEDAVAWYHKSTAFDPNYALAYCNLGLALREQGKLVEAIAACRKAIELDPNFAGAHHNLGRALQGQRKLEEAIAAFKKAIEINPKLAIAHYHLAWELTVGSELKLRDAKQALVSARLAVELDPTNCTYWQGLGYAEYRSKNWKAAVLAFQKVKELGSPGDSIEWFPLSMAYWQLGDKEAARKTYDQAVQWMEKNSPTDPFLRSLQVEAADLMGIKITKN